MFVENGTELNFLRYENSDLYPQPFQTFPPQRWVKKIYQSPDFMHNRCFQSRKPEPSSESQNLHKILVGFKTIKTVNVTNLHQKLFVRECEMIVVYFQDSVR